MRQDQWDQLLRGAVLHSKDQLERHMKLEMQIAAAYAFRHNVDYGVAKHHLEMTDRLLRHPSKKIEDVKAYGGHPYGEEGVKKQLSELMDIGRRAIAEFEKLKAYEFTFPNAKVNASTAGGWFGAPWDRELNFHRLSREYAVSNETFCFAGVGYGTCDLFFHFGYKSPLERITEAEGFFEPTWTKEVRNETVGDLRVRCYNSCYQGYVLVTDKAQDGREIITSFNKCDVFFEDYGLEAVLPGLFDSVLSSVKQNPDQFKLTKEDQAILEYIKKDVLVEG